VIMDFLSVLQFAFVQRAFLGGCVIAVLCAVLGLFLVLRKMSLIGDGLSHVSFGAVALGLLANMSPLYVALPLVVLASFVILKLTEKARLYGDAAIGIVSAIGIAGGVILASVSRGFNVDLFSYLFGNILSIGDEELALAVALSAVVLVVVAVFYNDLLAVTFDEDYARVSGIKTTRVNMLLMALTAVTVVLAIRVVGIMLISALLILPAATALQLARGFKGALLISALTAVTAVIAGICVSIVLDLPAGGAIVAVNLVFFLAALGVRKAAG
jgi:zinc transport system permease protein